MKKLKLNRVGILVVFIISSVLVLHDLYYILINMWLTGITCGWTLFGFITFIIALYASYNTFIKLKNWWDKA